MRFLHLLKVPFNQNLAQVFEMTFIWRPFDEAPQRNLLQ